MVFVAAKIVVGSPALIVFDWQNGTGPRATLARDLSFNLQLKAATMVQARTESPCRFG
jgi:hypothetical protein